MNNVKAELSIIGSFFIGLIGGCDTLIFFLILLVVVDYLTGVTQAIKNSKFKSAVMRWGAVNKVVEFAIVAIFYKIDQTLGLDVFRNGAIIWFLICEGSSILENCIQLGVPLPEGSETILKQLKSKISVSFTEIVKKIIDEKSAENTDK
jgi:toxin secretion/phage lysis holin